MIIRPIKVTDNLHAMIVTLFFLITGAVFVALYPSLFRHYFGAFFFGENVALEMIGMSSLSFLMSLLLEETLSRTVLTCLSPYGTIFSSFVLGKILLSNSKPLLAAAILIIITIFIFFSVRKKKHNSKNSDDFFEKSISDFLKDMGSSTEVIIKSLFVCLNINIPVGLVIMLLD